MGAETHVLVIGGQRSGKSRFAEVLVERSGRRPVYIATAAARDGEMVERIARHRRRRGYQWATVEESTELAASIKKSARAGNAVLVDCLTLWLANLLEADRDPEACASELILALNGPRLPPSSSQTKSAPESFRPTRLLAATPTNSAHSISGSRRASDA